MFSLFRPLGLGPSRRVGQIRFNSSVVKSYTDASEAVAIVKLNNPEKMNPLTVECGKDLQKIFEEIDYSKTSAVILTGEKTFSAGGDFQFLTDRGNDSPSRNTVIMREYYRLFLSLREKVPVPIIAAINGAAVGAGAGLALATDLRISSKNAKISFPFVKTLGIHPGMGTTYFLNKIVGPQVAARLLMTGEMIDGVEAARIGMVLESVEDKDLMPRAIDLATKIASNSPLAVRSLVRSLRIQFDDGQLERALTREADAQSYCYSSTDFKSGLDATMNKKKATWSNHESYGLK